MDTRQAGPRALGAYRGPWYAIAVPLLLGATYLFLGLAGHPDWWKIALGSAGLAIGLLPATVIRAKGVVIPRRFTRINWTDIAAIQEIDVPGSRECLRARLTDGRTVPLTGVPADRVPGLMLLARQHGRPPSDLN